VIFCGRSVIAHDSADRARREAALRFSELIGTDTNCHQLARIDKLGPNRWLIFTVPCVEGSQNGYDVLTCRADDGLGLWQREPIEKQSHPR
jgi:GTPase